MATGVAMQRNVSSASPVCTPGRVPNLPVIEHPMSRLGDRNDLAVMGSATARPGGKKDSQPAGIQRSHTELGVRGSNKAFDGQEVRKSTPNRLLNWPPAVDINPPFQYNDKPYKGVLPAIPTMHDIVPDIPDKVDKFPKVGQIPKLPPLPSIEEQEEYLKGPGKPYVRSKEYNYQPRTTPELIDLIRDKFGTGYYGIRHLFKANDPTGRGNVSREALQRILYTLCGYITPDQYSKLLREMHFEGKTPIHFDTFVQFFKDNEPDKKNWVGALQTRSMYQHSESSHPESYLKRTDLRIHDPYTSMPFSEAIFKEKCKSKNFDARKVFPASVFEVNGLILPPQLREAYASLGIYMVDDDFNKLWQRYDKEGTGALHTDHFFRLCGLDPHGHPRQAAPYTPRGAAYPKSRQRPHSEIGHTNGIETSTEAKKILKKEGVRIDDTETKPVQNKTIEVPTASEETAENTTDGKTQEKKIEIKKPPKVAPKLDNIIDCLHYKFEESYQAMLTAFQLFDFLNDNYISKIDFRRVLQEFGFSISPSEVEHFLKKCGVRALKGQVNYREFLNKYQNKSDSSITAKVAKDTNHPFHGDQTGQGATLSSDVLEARLIDHFHGDFIKLLSHLRQCDKYNMGVITPHEFRGGIERRLGYSMTEAQWDQLKQDVGQDKDGLICYTRFIELFDITPGSWNVVQEGNMKFAQVTAEDRPIPTPVEKLKERAKTEMVPSSPPPAEDFKSLEEKHRRKGLQVIQGKLDELFKNRFHTFDKHFKSMDRKMTGRMSKWQFGALLKMSGLSLQPKELDRVWATLHVATDGMYSYATLIQHFVNFKVPYEQKETVVYGNMFNVDEAEEIWWDSEEDTKDLVETARRIQRERREEQMKRDHLARMKARENNEEWKPDVPENQNGRVGTAASNVSRASSIPSIPPSRASFSSVQSVRTKSLLVKIRTDVVNNWEGLKSVFKYIDKNGTASIPMAEMKDIMNSMHFSLDEEEKSELCKRFDAQKNGRFNYLQFMKCYAQRQEKKAQSKPFVYSKYTHQLQTQLFKEHRTLRRAFRKLDQSQKGFLSPQDFKKALKICNIPFTNEDFYHILTEFDHSMNGRITYDNFLQTMLTA